MQRHTAPPDPLTAAKQVLAANEQVRYGIFGLIGGSGLFPPRSLLNEFLGMGHDLCDQDGRQPGWTPFAVSAGEFADLRSWWLAGHVGAVEDGLAAASWDDWVQQVLDRQGRRCAAAPDVT